jgi:hypothetical protein
VIKQKIEKLKIVIKQKKLKIKNLGMENGGGGS